MKMSAAMRSKRLIRQVPLPVLGLLALAFSQSLELHAAEKPNILVMLSEDQAMRIAASVAGKVNAGVAGFRRLGVEAAAAGVTLLSAQPVGRSVAVGRAVCSTRTQRAARGKVNITQLVNALSLCSHSCRRNYVSVSLSLYQAGRHNGVHAYSTHAQYIGQ